MRRLRAQGKRTPGRSGGAGAPPGDIRIPCEELADGRPRGLPEACRAFGPRKGPRPRAKARRNGGSESAARRRQDAADGAPRGARILQKRMRQDGKTGAPLGAPSPRSIEGHDQARVTRAEDGRTRRLPKEYGRPRAPFWQRIRAMAQRLLGPRFRGDDRGETIADPRINANREP
jgi:hypothetical protein